MTNLSNEIIPYAFYFVALIFFVASIKIKPKKIVKKEPNIKESFNSFQENNEIRLFLEDSEKKLIALKELYNQELIEVELYIKKTNQIANVVSKIIGNNVYDFAKNKNNQIIDEIRVDINKKIKSNDFKFKKKKEVNLDDMLISIENKINNNMSNEKDE